VANGRFINSLGKNCIATGDEKACPETYKERFAQSILGSKWLSVLTPTSDSSMWTFDPSEIARLLHPIFETLGIPYYITGGVAATVYGDPRTTRDLDLVIEFNRENISLLVEALERAEFYCPPDQLRIFGMAEGRYSV
jgi:hypothetical protein